MYLYVCKRSKVINKIHILVLLSTINLAEFSFKNKFLIYHIPWQNHFRSNDFLFYIIDIIVLFYFLDDLPTTRAVPTTRPAKGTSSQLVLILIYKFQNWLFGSYAISKLSFWMHVTYRTFVISTIIKARSLRWVEH